MEGKSLRGNYLALPHHVAPAYSNDTGPFKAPITKLDEQHGGSLIAITGPTSPLFPLDTTYYSIYQLLNYVIAGERRKELGKT